MTQGFRFDVRCYWCAGPTELVNPGAHATTETKAVVRCTDFEPSTASAVVLQSTGSTYAA